MPAQRTTNRGGGRAPGGWAAGGPRMVRVSFSAVLRIRAGGSQVLFEQRAERGVFGPVGDVLRCHPPASDVLRDLGFRGQRWAGWGPGPLAELAGEVPARSLAELRRWFDSGAYREDAAECLRRALSSTLTALGAADLAEDVASAGFAPLGAQVLGPEPVPDSPHRRLRHREHHELVCVDAQAHRLRDRLLELAADPTAREVLVATEEQVARGRAGAALVTAHAAVGWDAGAAEGAGSGVRTAIRGLEPGGSTAIGPDSGARAAIREAVSGGSATNGPRSGARAAIREARSGDSATTGTRSGAQVAIRGAEPGDSATTRPDSGARVAIREAEPGDSVSIGPRSGARAAIQEAGSGDSTTIGPRSGARAAIQEAEPGDSTAIRPDSGAQVTIREAEPGSASGSGGCLDVGPGVVGSPRTVADSGAAVDSGAAGSGVVADSGVAADSGAVAGSGVVADSASRPVPGPVLASRALLDLPDRTFLARQARRIGLISPEGPPVLTATGVSTVPAPADRRARTEARALGPEMTGGPATGSRTAAGQPSAASPPASPPPASLAPAAPTPASLAPAAPTPASPAPAAPTPASPAPAAPTPASPPPAAPAPARRVPRVRWSPGGGPAARAGCAR
ncbi:MULTISPECIES: hypothetical protein [Actinosynnema]